MYVWQSSSGVPGMSSIRYLRTFTVCELISIFQMSVVVGGRLVFTACKIPRAEDNPP